jgi:hypothetical protein
VEQERQLDLGLLIGCGLAQVTIPHCCLLCPQPAFMRKDSIAYKRYHARKYRKRNLDIKKLCVRLDKLVFRAERLKTGKTRAGILEQADKVRKKLRDLEH